MQGPSQGGHSGCKAALMEGLAVSTGTLAGARLQEAGPVDCPILQVQVCRLGLDPALRILIEICDQLSGLDYF